MINARTKLMSFLRKQESSAKFWMPAFAGMTVSMMMATSAHAEGSVHWKMQPDHSTIKWSANYSGRQVEGSLPSFTSNIVWDSTHLANCAVEVRVNMADVRSSDKDAQDNLPGGVWFAAKQYPVAMFNSTGFKHVKGDYYEATGYLYLHDIRKEITMPFVLKFTEHTVVMDGVTVLNRQDYGIGTGEWANPKVVANEVKVTVHLEAKDN